jgi:hypothetical protein
MMLNHIITAMVEESPRRVRCLTCGSEHNHRVTKSSTTITKTKSKKTTTTRGKGKNSLAMRWSTATSGWDDSQARAYNIFESFRVNDLVKHTKFGNGVVTEIPGPDRMITLFESGEKMLIQGRTRN